MSRVPPCPLTDKESLRVLLGLQLWQKAATPSTQHTLALPGALFIADLVS